MTIKMLSIVMVLLMFSMPCLTLAQQTNDAVQAMTDAKSDIKAPYYWFAGTFLTSIGLGCLGGSVIVAVSQVVPAHPPAHRLIGKSPEYVITYTSTYEKETKSKRLLHTFTGCVGGSAIAGLIGIYLYSETY